MDEIIAQLRALDKQRDDLFDQMQSLFETKLKELFESDEKLDAVQMSVSNHEFNDGDETSFSIGYDDLELFDSDGDELDNEPLQQKFVQLFESTQDIHERMYSRNYGDLTISRDSFTKE